MNKAEIIRFGNWEKVERPTPDESAKFYRRRAVSFEPTQNVQTHPAYEQHQLQYGKP